MSHHNPSQDYLDFMIGKLRSSNNSSRPTQAPSRNDTNKSHNYDYNQQQQMKQQQTKQSNHNHVHRHICQIFFRIMKDDFLIPDDTAEQVIDSIYNLREVIYNTSHVLSIQEEQMMNENDNNIYCHDDSSGNPNNEKLTRKDLLLFADDLHLTLSDNLIRHERMLTSLRQLISCMGQAIEQLGRQLNRFYECSTTITATTSTSITTTIGSDLERGNRDQANKEEEGENVGDDVINYHHVSFLPTFYDKKEAEISVSSLTILYKNLSKELYRKQLLVNDIMNTCNDNLLYHDDDDNTNKTDVDDDMNHDWMMDPMNHYKDYHKTIEMMERMMAIRIGTTVSQKDDERTINKPQKLWSRRNNLKSYLYDSNEFLDEILNSNH